MKRNKLFCLVLTALLLSSMCFPVSADISINADIATKDSLQEAKAFLIENGIDSEIIFNLNGNLTKPILDNFKTKPEIFQFDKTVTFLDEFSTIEYIVNTADDILLQQGASPDEIIKVRQYLQEFTDKTKEQLAEELSRTEMEVCLLQEALKPSNSYYKKSFTSDVVTSSGTISTNTLQYDLMVIDESEKQKTPYAIILAFFEWQKDPLWPFEDVLAFAWSGGLLSKDFDMTFDKAPKAYYNPIMAGAFDYSWGWERAAGAGLELKYQKNIHYSWCTGAGGCIIYNTGKLTGNSAEVISKYLYRKLWLGDFSISWPPAITVKSGYDESIQAYGIIKI